MSTRSPRRLDRLCFLLRRKPTIRTTENLERRHSLSLSLETQTGTSCTFSPIFGEENYLLLSLFSLNISIILIVSLVLIFDTWFYLSHSSHILTNHATCVTWVHVVGDFCHITCLSKTILRHSTLGASKKMKFRLSRNQTKFDMVARFRETTPTVKSVSSSKI